MVRVHLIISGDVQGMGFRAWARSQAQQLGLTGWVKNRDDGSVEIVAEGAKVEEFIKRCQKGSEVAWVDKVNVEWQQATGEFMRFEVVY